MATEQQQNSEIASQGIGQKTEGNKEENQLKLIPIDYLALVLILAPLFGDPDSKEITDFWNENRKDLREIFSDFPEFDISEGTVKKILMTIDVRDFVNLDSYYFWLEPLITEVDNFIATKKKSKAQPVDVRKDSHAYLCLLETPTGTAFGRKLTGRRKSKYWRERELKDYVDISNTLVIRNIKEVKPSDLSLLIGRHADYILPIYNKKLPIFKEILSSFEKYPNPKEISEIIEGDNGTELTRSIRIVPTNNLSAEIKEDWEGLKEGSLLKVSIKKGKRSQGSETYFISSLPFILSNIEESAARSIWQYWNIKDVLDEITMSDCHFDIGAGRNAAYLNNCYNLKVFSKRIMNILEEHDLFSLIKPLDKQSSNDKKKSLCSLLKEIGETYYGELEDRASTEFLSAYGYLGSDDY